MKKKILVRGPVLSQSGYGEQARFALRSLRSREDLFDIYVQPINYTTVPRGTERLRFTPSPVHGPNEINHLVESMDYLWSHCALNRAELSA